MHLLYFDEVKYQEGVQPYYRLGGLMMDESLIPQLEDEVNSLAKECFGTTQLSPETEFHAKHLFHKKGHFKSWEPEKRIDVLCRLTKIADRHDDLYKIIVTIDPSKMVAKTNIEHKAFMFLVEKFQSKLAEIGSRGMMIGDHEQSMVSPSTYNLSRFRENGTDFQFGKKIDRLMDTVHFTHSHHSRLLQLADAYLYAIQMSSGGAKNSWSRTKYIEFIKNETRILSPHKYKDWPTDYSWYST